MPITATRRTTMSGIPGLICAAFGLKARAAAGPADAALREASRRIATLETRHGGRLGVAALDTGTGRRIDHRSGERFPMCSTFKWLAVAAVLRQVDLGSESLDRQVHYNKKDLLHYAPVTAAHVHAGRLTIGELCAAAIEWSDNTAANLLLRILGGPRGVTRFARSLNDAVTRLDRNEPTLNTALPDDVRDTTSPSDMIRDLHAAVLGKVLSATSRQNLQTWLMADQVGGNRIRAGVPRTWKVGDKTGTGDNGTTNDVAVIWPPGRAPILIASYYTGATGTVDDVERTHAEVGRIVIAAFGTA
jgi:beta-lactamase class A